LIDETPEWKKCVHVVEIGLFFFPSVSSIVAPDF